MRLLFPAFRTLFLLLVTVFLSSFAAIGAPVYGNLKQSDVPDCAAFACGPVAAVNSFVYLQTRYPDIYGASLVGVFSQQPPALHWLQLAASILAETNYMDTCCGRGTPIEKFILGKQKYIEDRIPGTTTYKAQMDIPWRPEVAGSAANPSPKPSYVEDSTFPNVAFLRQELAHGEDVELFLDLEGPVDHYVTLTSISPAQGGGGDINWVDPLTGQQLTDGAIYEIVTEGFNRRLRVTYQNPITLQFVTANVTAAVSESPIPEPGSWTLVLMAIGALTLRRRRLTQPPYRKDPSHGGVEN